MKLRGLRLLGAVCLTLCVALSGCAPPESVADAPAPSSVTGRAAGLTEDEPILTVDGRSVPAWEYLYWLSLACDRARGQASGGVPDWPSVKEQALMNTALYASVETLAERYGLGTDNDVSERWRRRCEAYGTEEGYLREIARYGLDRDRAETLFRVGLLYGKLRALCATDSAFSPEAAELDALAKESGTVQVDRILAADADRDAAKRRAERFFMQLNGAANQAELFTELTWEGADHAGPRTLREGTFNERLTQVVRAMRVGQVSGVIEAEDGFSILRRLPPERDSLLDIWLRRTVEDAARTADVELSDRYFQIDPEEFAAALDALRGEL